MKTSSNAGWTMCAFSFCERERSRRGAVRFAAVTGDEGPLTMGRYSERARLFEGDGVLSAVRVRLPSMVCGREVGEGRE